MKFLNFSVFLALLSLLACSPSQDLELSEDRPDLTGDEIETIRYASTLSLYELLGMQSLPGSEAYMGKRDDFVAHLISNQDNFEELDELVLFYRESELVREGRDPILDGQLNFGFSIDKYDFSIVAGREDLTKPFFIELRSIYNGEDDEMVEIEGGMRSIVDAESGYRIVNLVDGNVVKRDGIISIPEVFSTSPFESNRQIRWDLRRARLLEAAHGTLTVLAVGSLVSAASNSRLGNNTRHNLAVVGFLASVLSANVTIFRAHNAYEARDYSNNYVIKDVETGEWHVLESGEILERLRQTAPTLEGLTYEGLVAADGKTMKNPFVESYLLHLEDLLGPLGFMSGDVFIRRYRNADFVNALIYVVTRYKNIENPIEYHNSGYRYYDELAELLKQMKRGSSGDVLFNPSW